MIGSESLVLVAHEPDKNMIPSAAGSHVRGSPLKASAAGNEEIDLLLPGTARWVFYFLVSFLYFFGKYIL
mgnify:FL=1